MIEKKTGPLSIFFFESLLKQKGVDHFVSTRFGGFSSGVYEFLNLGFHVGDDPRKVKKNRALLTSTLKIHQDSFITSKQTHGDTVMVVTEKSKKQGENESGKAVGTADAMITNLPHVCLMVLVADCAPILFLDTAKRAIGVVHAGWRGTVRCIVQNAVKMLQKSFGSLPGDIIVGIGPSIGPCCYEVGPEVIGRIEKRYHDTKGYIDRTLPNGRGYFDLWRANKVQLIQAGISEENIEIARICTCCQNNKFFSERYQKGKTGRFGGGIVLRG